MFKKTFIGVAAAAFLVGSSVAAELKIGFVNPQMILSQSAPAVAAQKKLQKLFKPREDEVTRLIRDFKAKAAKYEKDKAVLSEAERNKQHKALADQEREIARKQRALVEERNQRSNEEVQAVIAKAGKIIQDIAKNEKYDLIIQEPPAYVNPKIDITEKVMKRLQGTTTGK